MTDRCDVIRNKLKDKNVDISKYDLCYTKSLTIQNEPECSLCRCDKVNKSFICRPNEHDEETYTAKDFCTPLKNIPANELENKYYPSIINTCKSLKNSKNSKNRKSLKNSKNSKNRKS